ncbi:hypothetical protein K435DRAFT_776054 [Dendrothele bispora CBS 962.96]|uniref:Uncharacterized protein n=1 Tax=Dendrothele bispora (strain CBS 962.96) TaxID=1314807 RepID=A0A4S8MFQ0_DENBC|nr:hypothetical protein K435DRAFT_776054 [Dendrothele bispora CBS 962.96]
MQDPLSSVPHQTYQAHRDSRHLHQAQGQSAPSPSPQVQGHPSLPPKPTFAPGSTSATGPSVTPVSTTTAAAATISAAPELRDFKKEATAFVPSALAKRKRPGASSSAGGGGGGGGLGRVNAAPLTELEEEGDDQINQKGGGMKKPDLLGTLRGQFPFASSAASAPNKKAKVEEEIESSKEKKKDDYEKFMEEIGDIL